MRRKNPDIVSSIFNSWGYINGTLTEKVGLLMERINMSESEII